MRGDRDEIRSDRSRVVALLALLLAAAPLGARAQSTDSLPSREAPAALVPGRATQVGLGVGLSNYDGIRHDVGGFGSVAQLFVAHTVWRAVSLRVDATHASWSDPDHWFVSTTDRSCSPDVECAPFAASTGSVAGGSLSVTVANRRGGTRHVGAGLGAYRTSSELEGDDTVAEPVTRAAAHAMLGWSTEGPGLRWWLEMRYVYLWGSGLPRSTLVPVAFGISF